MADMDPQTLIQWWDSLRSKRNNFDSRWQEIVDQLWPDGPDFTSKERTQGHQRTERQYDPIATLSLEKFTAVMEALNTPRMQRWHRCTSTNEDLNKIQRVREYWDEKTDWLFKKRRDPRARFHTEMYDGWKSEGAFGNLCMFVESRPTGGIRYRNIPISNTWVAMNEDGVVDTVFRSFKLAAIVAKTKYGDGMPESAREDLKKDPFIEREYLQAVMPRQNVDFDHPGTEGMPFVSYELAVKDKQILNAGGYRTWPLPFGRYTRRSEEDYGRGPASIVMPSVRTVNEMKRSHLEAGEQVSRPSMLLPEDGIIGSHDNGEIDLTAGSFIYGGTDERGQQIMKPLVTGARLDISREMMQDEHSVIDDAFLVNLFQSLIDHPQRTAFEVLQEIREKGQLITPTVGRQHDEVLGPLIHRELGIMAEQDGLDDMPPELVEAEGEYDVIYDSPATQMARADELLSVEGLLETSFAIIEAMPEEAATVRAMISVPEVLRLKHDAGGSPAKILRGEDEVEEILAAEAQQRKDQQALEQLPPVAGAVKDLAAAAPQLSEVA